MSEQETILVKQRGGCVDALIIIVVCVALLFGGCTFCSYIAGKAVIETVKDVSEIKKKPEDEKLQGEDAEKIKKENPAEHKQDVIVKDYPPITTLENVTLPVTLVSIDEFSLLGNSGNQTTIPKGSIITVESRNSGGTLTMRINGETFVGNESRLVGKAKVNAERLQPPVTNTN